MELGLELWSSDNVYFSDYRKNRVVRYAVRCPARTNTVQPHQVDNTLLFFRPLGQAILCKKHNSFSVVDVKHCRSNGLPLETKNQRPPVIAGR